MKNITLQEYPVNGFGVVWCRKCYKNNPTYGEDIYTVRPENMLQALKWVVAHETDYHTTRPPPQVN